MTEKAYDVVVVGGGLAGVAAAISAARLGSKIVLIQDRPVLGGNSSSEIRVPIGGAGMEVHTGAAKDLIGNMPWVRETGIIEELFTEHIAHDAVGHVEGKTRSTWDLLLYEKVVNETNIDIFLNTSARSVKLKKDSIEELQCIQIGSEKAISLNGCIFVDATGDGTIAALAGAQWRMGREARDEFDEENAPPESDDITMGSSLMFHAKDVKRPVEFVPPKWAAKFPSDEDLPFREHSEIDAGYWWVEVGNPPFNTIVDNEKIRNELVKQLLGVWDHIKNHGDHGADNYVLDWIGMVPGKRESRRVLGDYVLSEKDVKSANLFHDRVAYGGFFIDIHTEGGILAKGCPPEPSWTGDIADFGKRVLFKPYSIPFRCLYSKDIKNLMMAGRDISVTHVALGTTRGMPTCEVIGQAVGTASHLCSKYKSFPKSIYKNYISELQQLLLKQDCYIPKLKNQDVHDKARNATVTASSCAQLEFPEGREKDGLHIMRAQLFPVSADRIDTISILIDSKCSEDVELTLCLRPAKDIWDFSQSEDLVCLKEKVIAHSFGWIKYKIDLKVIPHKLYWVYLSQAEGIFWVRSKFFPTGTLSAFKFMEKWKCQKHVYAMTIDPVSFPYEASNVIDGTARPEEWTHIWISDPNEPLPQTIEINFNKTITFNSIYLTFDTNLSRDWRFIPGLYKAPECVKDYKIEYLNGHEWEALTEIHGNYHRRRIHKFPCVESSKLKLTINKTNGKKSAYIYEIRVYDE